MPDYDKVQCPSGCSNWVSPGVECYACGSDVPEEQPDETAVLKELLDAALEVNDIDTAYCAAPLGLPADATPCQIVRGIKALTAEVERLRAALEPGTQAAMVAASFKFAQKLGMSPFSSEPPTVWIERYINALTARVRELEAVKQCHSGIYCASRVKHAAMWAELRAHGAPIIATWIDEAGEGQTGEHAELAERCIREATQAQAVVLYCEPGDILKGALIEVGAALAVGIPVFSVGDCESLSKRTFCKHPLWTECDTLRAAIDAAIAKEGV